MKQRVTLRDLAVQLELSPTTVSRAINGYSEVSEKTRRRVLDMVEQMGYEPDRNAQRLAQGNTSTFGIVVTSKSGRDIGPIFSEFISGVTEYLTSVQFDLLVSPARQINELEVYRKLAAQRAVDGFIISAPNITDPRVELLESLNVPYIVHGRTTCDHPYNWIDVDNMGSFNKAARLLIDYGHVRIALIGEENTSLTYSSHRYQGYSDALQANHIPIDPELVVEQDMTVASAYKTTKKLLSLAKPPTAFLCSSTLIAYGVMKAANEARLYCPRDYSLIAYDDKIQFIDADYFSPPLTTLQSSISRAGKRCAKILHDYCLDNSKPVINEQLPVELVLRDSVGAALKTDLKTE